MMRSAAIGPPDCRDHSRALPRSKRERFLEIHVLLRVEGLEKHRHVLVIRCGDDNAIQAGLRQHFSREKVLYTAARIG